MVHSWKPSNPMGCSVHLNMSVGSEPDSTELKLCSTSVLSRESGTPRQLGAR